MSRQAAAEYIKKHINLIAQRDFQTLYDNNLFDAGEMSLLLIEAGANPLLYMKEVPEGFLYNTKISCFDIPDGVTTIGMGAFENCTQMIQIGIPNSITTIEYHAFKKCNSLDKIIFKGTMEDFNNINVDTLAFDKIYHSIQVICTDGELDI